MMVIECLKLGNIVVKMESFKGKQVENYQEVIGMNKSNTVATGTLRITALSIAMEDLMNRRLKIRWNKKNKHFMKLSKLHRTKKQ